MRWHLDVDETGCPFRIEELSRASINKKWQTCCVLKSFAGKRLVDYRRFLRRFDVAVNKEKWVSWRFGLAKDLQMRCQLVMFWQYNEDLWHETPSNPNQSMSVYFSAAVCSSKVGWKTFVMKDAYEALYCKMAALQKKLQDQPGKNYAGATKDSVFSLNKDCLR